MKFRFALALLLLLSLIISSNLIAEEITMKCYVTLGQGSYETYKYSNQLFADNNIFKRAVGEWEEYCPDLPTLNIKENYNNHGGYNHVPDSLTRYRKRMFKDDAVVCETANQPMTNLKLCSITTVIDFHGLTTESEKFCNYVEEGSPAANKRFSKPTPDLWPIKSVRHCELIP